MKSLKMYRRYLRAVFVIFPPYLCFVIFSHFGKVLSDILFKEMYDLLFSESDVSFLVVSLSTSQLFMLSYGNERNKEKSILW